jgi:hypothetical protein
LRLNATEIVFDRYFTLTVSDGLKYYLGRRVVRGIVSGWIPSGPRVESAFNSMQIISVLCRMTDDGF